MLVLQSCTDSLHFLPGSYSEIFPSSSDGTNDVSSIGVEENVVVIEEGFIAISEEAAVRTKQEKIPGNINFSGLKSEAYEVSFVCMYMSVIRHISPVSRNVNCFCDPNISGQLNHLNFWE
jgi:hypothetical protein